MSHKVKGGVRPKQVLLTKWICGSLVAAAIIVGFLVGTLDGEVVIANGMYALAVVGSYVCVATIHARHITRHAAACTKEAESHTDKRINDIREHTDRRVDELQKMIRFAAVYEVDQYLQDRDGRSN